MIYFLYRSYTPNTAYTNRALAYFKNIEKLKIPITVVYFLPDSARSRIREDFKYINFKYYWDRYFLNHKRLQFFSYHWYLNLFSRNLKSGDKVYIYGYSDICKIILRRKDVEVFFEVTECPEVSLPSSPLCKVDISDHISLCKKVSRLIVISQSLKDYYISKGVDSSLIQVVNMTVDTTRFLGITKTQSVEKYIAYCGTISNDKDGVDCLIKAFAIFIKKHHDIKLYIIGSAPPNNNLISNVQLIDSLGINGSIVFKGLIPAHEMPQLLVNAEALVLSRPNNLQARYGFPTKLGEYLLTGNPVVVSAVGDIPSASAAGPAPRHSPAWTPCPAAGRRS